MDFAVLTDHWVKLQENEKKDKYLNLARELKKLWNFKVTFKPIVIGALGTVTEGLLLKTTTLLKSVRILRRVLDTRRNLLSLQWKTIG